MVARREEADRVRPAFLRSRIMHFCPFEARDEAPAIAAPWRLASSGTTGEAIPMAAVTPEDSFLGLARLEDVDWVRRTAGLALRWSGPEAGMGEALRLLVAYAFDELNLERVEARPVPGDEAARRALGALGFRQDEAAAWVRDRA